MKRLLNNPNFRAWLPLAISITGLMAFLYLGLQMQNRSLANDTLIQLGQNATSALVDNGQTPTDLLRDIHLDPRKLDQFVIIYDENFKPLTNNVKVDGIIPAPPKGSFEFVDKNTSQKNLLTWEPQKGLRLATIIQGIEVGQKGKTEHRYILAARNLKLYEQRADQLLWIATLAWLIIMAASFFSVTYMNKLSKTHKDA